MLIKSTSNYDDLDDLVLGELAGTAKAANAVPNGPPEAEPAAQPSLIAEEVVETPLFMAKPRGGLGTRLAAAVLNRSPWDPLDARITDVPPPDERVRAPKAPVRPPAAAPAAVPAPAATNAPEPGLTVAPTPPAPAAAAAPTSRKQRESQAGSNREKRVSIGEASAPRRVLLARARPALIASAAAAAFAVTVWVSYTAGQKSHVPQVAVAIDQAGNSATPAFGLTAPISVTAPAPVAPASAAAVEPSSSGVLAPDSVLAAASANLPPMASLPPAIDEHRADQRQSSGKGSTPVPTAPGSSSSAPSAAQGGAQQPDGLIALGGEAPQAPVAERGVAGPTTNTGPADAKRAGPLHPTAAPAAAAPKAEAPKTDTPDQGAAGNVRKMKYGSMGITALTATSVVLVNGKQGQFAVSKGQALPDGSIVQAIDPNNHRITTNHGVIQLD